MAKSTVRLAIDTPVRWGESEVTVGDIVPIVIERTDGRLVVLRADVAQNVQQDIGVLNVVQVGGDVATNRFGRHTDFIQHLDECVDTVLRLEQTSVHRVADHLDHREPVDTDLVGHGVTLDGHTETFVVGDGEQVHYTLLKVFFCVY